MSEQFTYFCGKPISEMSREELVSALTAVCGILEDAKKTLETRTDRLIGEYQPKKEEA